MITRLVRMQFRPESIALFRNIFEDSKHKIRSFEGCLYLSLHQDANDETVLYTLSKWESEHHLDAYRQSELFKTTWAKTKALFQEKAIAYSLSPQEELL